MTDAAMVVLQSGPDLSVWTWTLSRSEQYLVSAILLLGFLLLGVVVYVLGEPLKRRLDDEAVEAIQSSAMTLAGLLVAGMLVGVWRLSQEVGTAFDFVETGPREGVLVLVTVAAFGAAFTVTRITKRLIRRGSERDAITAHQKEVAHHVVQLLIFAPAALFALALWGANPQNLLIGAGAAGLVVGLAARQTLGAVIAGFVLLLARPFEVNDWVVVDEVEGVVTDISIFNTEIRTFDNESVVIPNDEVTKNNIINRSRNGKLRLQVDVGVDYDVEVAEAMELARDEMYVLDEVLDEPAPDVVVDEFGASSVALTLRFWIADPSIERKWAAQNAVVDAVKAAFEEEGVKIPYPQRELTGREETGGLRVAGSGVEGAAGNGNGAPRSAVEQVEETDDGRGTHMSAVTDPTVEIDRTDGRPEPRPTDGDRIQAVERVEAEEPVEPVEPLDPEDD